MKTDLAKLSCRLVESSAGWDSLELAFRCDDLSGRTAGGGGGGAAGAARAARVEEGQTGLIGFVDPERPSVHACTVDGRYYRGSTCCQRLPATSCLMLFIFHHVTSFIMMLYHDIYHDRCDLMLLPRLSFLLYLSWPSFSVHSLVTA